MALLFCLLLMITTAADELPALTPAKPLAGRIEEIDREVHTSTLDSEGYATAGKPARGRSYRLQINKAGIYSIVLRSYLFDAYLVLRDADGKVIAEDDDSLIGTHARIVKQLAVGEVYRLEVCALREGVGPFELTLIPGKPKKLSEREQAEAQLTEKKRAVVVQEREWGPEHPNMATSLNSLAVLLYEHGKYEDARPLFERTLAIDEKVLGSEHPTVAMSLKNLAQLLEIQEKYEEARPLYERALAIREKVLGPENTDVARSLNNLATLLNAQGKHEEARPLYERALTILEKAQGREHPDVGASLIQLAGLSKAQGKYEEARPLYERALAILEKLLGPEHLDVAAGLHNLALMLDTQGKYEEARPLFERALAIFEKVLGPEHTGVAMGLSNLGVLLHTQGKHEEARPLYERALVIQEKVLGPEHPDVAQSLNNMAGLLYDQGKYDAARRLFERVLAIEEKVLGLEHPKVATTLNNLAALLYAQGRHEEARPLYERALAIREKELGLEHTDVAGSLHNLSALLCSQGKYEEARPLHERALAIREKVLGPEHPDVATSLNNLIYLELDSARRPAALNLGRRLLAQGRDRLLAQLALSSESDALIYAGDQQDNIEAFLSAATLEERAESYEAVLNWKGQVSRAFGQSKRRLLADLTDDQRAKLERLRAVQGSLSNLLSANEIKDRGVHARNLERLRKERARLGAELQQSGAKALQSQRVTIAQLGAALPERSVWVDFLEHRLYEPAQWKDEKLVTKGQWSTRVTAWIVQPRGALVQVSLGESAALRDAIAQFLDSTIRHRGMTVEQDSAGVDPLKQANDQVRALLWQPLAKHIGDAKQVFVCSDAYLATLPFEILKDSDDKFLIEKHAFSYLRDGSALVELKERKKGVKPEPTFLVIGAIDYDERDESVPEGIEVASLRGNDDGDFEFGWMPLSETRREVDGIHRFHRKQYSEFDRRLLQEEEASEECLKSELSKYSVIHLATHGYFQPAQLPSAWESVQANVAEESQLGARADLGLEHKLVTGYLPGFLSGLVCAGANVERDPKRDNGLLTAEEVTWIDLSHCDLVVLSACQTALGTTRAGEGMMSLRRAFHQAGAKTVISSLWKVRDDSTRKLMLRFYDNLWNRKLGKLEALRAAQIDMLNQNRKRYGRGLPSTWGAFVLSGEG